MRSRPLAAVLLSLLLPVVAAAGLAGRAGAQSGSTQAQLQQQANDADAAEQSARSDLAAAQNKSAQAAAALSGITAKLDAANQQLAAAQAKVDALAAAAAALQAKIDDTKAKLAAAKEDVRRSALLLYTQGDSSADMIGLIGSVDGSGELVEGRHYLERVSDKRQTDAERVAHLESALASQQADLAQQQKDAEAARAAAADEKDALDALAAQQSQARDAAAAAEADQSAKLDAAKSVAEQADAALQAESDRLAQLARDSGGGPVVGNGTFIWPVNAPITSGFGYRTDPVTGTTEFHSGLDLGAACGTPIRAAASGVVLEAGWDSGGYGNMTFVNDGGGLATLYGHQSSIVVSAGQTVTQGQVIGYVGSTGKSTGCHLHFEVRVNGTPVDPLGYL